MLMIGLPLAGSGCPPSHALPAPPDGCQSLCSPFTAPCLQSEPIKTLLNLPVAFRSPAVPFVTVTVTDRHSSLSFQNPCPFFSSVCEQPQGPSRAHRGPEQRSQAPSLCSAFWDVQSKRSSPWRAAPCLQGVTGRAGKLQVSTS